MTTKQPEPMTKQTHTPGQWALNGNELITEDGWIAAQICGNSRGYHRFILNAVNSHETLLAALKDCVAAMSSLHAPNMMAATNNAVAAIAKAEGSK